MSGRGTSGGVVFQAEVGAYIAAGILAERPLSRLDTSLPGSPEKVLFETLSAVDDILVETDVGTIFFQAKRTISLSDNVTSDLASVVSQFVKQYREGVLYKGILRHLDVAKDRLVLVVSDESPDTITQNLCEILDRYRTGAATGLPVDLRTPLIKFAKLIKATWFEQTGSRISSADKAAILRLCSVVVITPAHKQLAEEALRDVVSVPGEESSLLDQLIAWAADSSSRGVGGDAAAIRLTIAGKTKLKAPPSYQADFDRLEEYTIKTLGRLKRFTVIHAPEKDITIERAVVDAVVNAARSGHLAITGDPGAGKSAVISTAAEKLREEATVVVLAVDASSTSLSVLSQEIGLQRLLADLLKHASGHRPAYLFLDALDAVRGGIAEATYRNLVEEVSRLKGWYVVASVRTFDLRLGKEWRRVFAGTPPIADHADATFPAVRHVHIKLLEDDEKNAIFTQSVMLQSAVDAAGPCMEELVRNPFNMSLLSDLLRNGIAPTSFSGVATRGDLLEMYWSERVIHLGISSTIALKTVVEEMVGRRSIDIPETAIPMAAAETVTELCRLGVLALETTGRLGFRHHILFDYAVARLLLAPDRTAALTYISKEAGSGLLIAPAIAYWLERLRRDLMPKDYWAYIMKVVGEDAIDPIVRVEYARLTVEAVQTNEDLAPLVEVLAAPGSPSDRTFQHLVGTLVTKAGDKIDFEVRPWARLTAQMGTPKPDQVWTLCLLVGTLLEKNPDAEALLHLGAASRILFDEMSENEDWIPRLAPYVLPFVAQTFGTDPIASGERLRKLLEARRFQKFGHIEIPWLVRNINEIASYDPGLVLDFYYRVFRGGDFSRDQTTSISNSWILSLTSNAAQDFGMAAHELSRSYKDLLVISPEFGTRALARALLGEQQKEHKIDENIQPSSINFMGASYTFLDDQSSIWAWNVDKEDLHDYAKLYQIFRDWAVAAHDADRLLSIPRWLLEESGIAIIWRLILDIGADHSSVLGAELWDAASSQTLLKSHDTMRSAVNFLSRVYSTRTIEELQNSENQWLQMDFLEFREPERARTEILGRLFNAIGSDNLQTEAAKEFLSAAKSDGSTFENRAPFEFHSCSGSDRHWLEREGVDVNEPSNAALLSLNQNVKQACTTFRNSFADTTAAESAWNITASLWQAIEDAGPVGSKLEEELLDTLADALGLCVLRNLLPSDRTANAISKILEISRHADPVAQNETEENFERFQSWGSPAPRIQAAEALTQLACSPGHWPAVKTRYLELLFDDPHPAVRYLSVPAIPRIGHFDSVEMWKIIERFLVNEQNTAVLMKGLYELSYLYGDDEVRLEPHVLKLVDRVPKSERGRDPITGLIVRYAIYRGYAESLDMLAGWVKNFKNEEGRLHEALYDIRDAIIIGMNEEDEEKDTIRGRAQEFLTTLTATVEPIIRSLPTINGHPNDEQKAALKLFSKVADQLFFAVGHDTLEPDLVSQAAQHRFLQEYKPMIMLLMALGTPNTVHHLLEMIRHFVPTDPEGCFDIFSEAMLRTTGVSKYQYESMGAQLFVDLVTLYLADYRAIFDHEARRANLIDCIALFVEAGWPEARRLFSRLPELFK